MILDKYKNFCVMPWIDFYKDPDGSNKICCVTNVLTPSNPDSGVKEVLNSIEHNNVRKTMLEDKPIPNCVECIKREEHGDSFRIHYNNGFLDEEYEKYILENTNSDGSLKKIYIRNLDIRFSNKCNFKCRMCGSQYSTAWDKENQPHIQIKEKISLNNIEKWFIENLEYLKDLKFLYFAGGEPLIQDQHYKFLELCITHKIDPQIFYQTNGSVLKYKDWDIFDLWKNFTKVSYSLSLDGLGKMGEYIRTGFKEKTILKNIQQIRNSEIVDVNYINIVVQAYNILYLTEFLDEVFEKKIIDRFDQILFVQIMSREFFQPKVLPKHLKLIAIDKIKNSSYYKTYPETFTPFIKNLEEECDPELWTEFCNHNNRLDKLRNTSINSYFTELK